MSELSISDCVHSTTYFEQEVTTGLALFSLLPDQPSPALLLSLQPLIYPQGELMQLFTGRSAVWFLTLVTFI